MEYTQEITLDLNSNIAYTTVGAKQGDHNTRIVKVHITQNGIDYNLAEQRVSAAYFRFRKPDGKAIINTCTINNDNTISLALTSQTLAVSGRGYADITLMSGSSILSTVSFIIVIMSSPQVAGEATSSNEFGYLNAVVEDATHTIYEAEAWAAGTRGGTSVFGINELSSDITSEVITGIDLDNETFKSVVGSAPGLKRIFTFVYNSEAWKLNTQAIEGTTITNYNPESVGNIGDYGITIEFIGGVDSPDNGDSIKITLQEADLQYENNAKYYTEQAELSKQSIENLDASVEMLDENATPVVNKTSIDDVTVISASENLGEVTINQQTFINAVQNPGNYTFTYSGSNWMYQSNVITLSNYGISYSQTGAAVSGNSIVVNYNEHVHLDFQLPRGETGNVNFMTFEVNTTDGELYMYRPSDLTQVDFSIIESGENEGCLGVEINMGGNS